MSIEPGQELHENLRQRLEEDVFLARLGLTRDLISGARRAAERCGASLEAQLICEDEVTERTFYEAMADHLGLTFWEKLPTHEIADDPSLDLMLKTPHSVRLQDAHHPAIMMTAPPLNRLGLFIQHLAAYPPLTERVALTTPSAMRSAVWARGAERRIQQATLGLFEQTPQFSARIPVTAAQGFWIGSATVALGPLLLFQPEVTLAIIHLVLSALYLGTLLFRLVVHLPRRPAVKGSQAHPEEVELPDYTVMVALYREAEVVPQLIQALSALDWPKPRLDIKLVCEASDPETLQALAAMNLPYYMEEVVVPDAAPRTKPKALAYALAGARGEYVTIYDAEDRPHPGQIRAAHAAFRAGGPELACLQAPLTITNAQEGWLSSLFAAEYSVHFRHYLPFLAARALPVPLGGTSNHFKRAALEDVGAWDPFNVTEDADLGLRLHRLGFRVGTIEPPTLEDAPEALSVWMNQRTRWFKGWLQTFLVSMRNPRRLRAEIGWISLITFLLGTSGMLISALCHPLLFASLGWLAVQFLTINVQPSDWTDSTILTIDLIDLFASYGYFALAGFGMPGRDARGFGWRGASMIPLYWVLLSYAAWRALIELYRRPHFWAKTPHRPTGQGQEPPKGG